MVAGLSPRIQQLLDPDVEAEPHTPAWLHIPDVGACDAFLTQVDRVGRTRERLQTDRLPPGRRVQLDIPQGLLLTARFGGELSPSAYATLYLTV